MNISQLKNGSQVKINFKEVVEYCSVDNIDEAIENYFEPSPKIKKWLKNYNLFTIVDVDQVGGVFATGESWQYVIIKPVLIGDIDELDFSYEDEDENGETIIKSGVFIKFEQEYLLALAGG